MWDASFNGIVELLEEDRQVNGEPRFETVGDVGVEDAGWKQVKLELPVIVDDRTAGVLAALESSDVFSVQGEVVGDLALSLISPVGSKNRTDRRLASFCLHVTVTFRGYRMSSRESNWEF